MLNAVAGGVTSMTDPVDPITHKLAITATSKVTNASAVEYKEKWQTDNDLVKKFVQVYNPADCSYSEVQDPTDTWKKGSTHTAKGLSAISGPSKTWYLWQQNRNCRRHSTNLPDNGFLSNFKLYWDFDVNKNLVPDIANTQWVWNSEATRFNAKGMELETRDALNIYSSAQYGYAKTLPVAVANNSRYQEMFYDGFEDYRYQEGMNANNFQHLYPRKHIQLGNMPDATILDADSMNMNAHSGKYVLALPAGYVAEKRDRDQSHSTRNL